MMKVEPGTVVWGIGGDFPGEWSQEMKYVGYSTQQIKHVIEDEMYSYDVEKIVFENPHPPISIEEAESLLKRRINR